MCMLHVHVQLHARCTHAARTLHARCTHTARTRHAHCTHTLHAHGTHTLQVRGIFETRKRVEVTLRYSAEQKGTLLGKGGATINRISTESGAQLDLGKDPDCSIRIHGLAPAVAVAKELLEELLFLKAACVQMLGAACGQMLYGARPPPLPPPPQRTLSTLHRVSTAHHA